MNTPSSSSSSSSSGIGFVGLLTIAFIVLKLCGVINWSWWWVLAPLWISFGVVLFIIAIVIVIGFYTNFGSKK